jgi:type II secretory pathway component PulJ
VAEAPSWLFDEVEKSFRGFFWSAKDRATGGQCLIAWNQICKPIEHGGLGVKNLRLQGLALRVRWEWLRRTDPRRPWQALPPLSDTKAREVFDSLVQINTGDGRSVLFWRDRWINGQQVADIAPSIVTKVKKRAYNARTVQQGMLENRWTLDIQGTLSDIEAMDCTRLWAAVQGLDRDLERADQFRWPWASNGEYSAKSTYNMMTHGSTTHPLGRAIWKCKATPKSKQYVWLASQDRIWSTERRFRHGLQNNSPSCEVCLQEEETAEHILLQCVIARETWHICRLKLDLHFEDPTRASVLQEWWTTERNRLRGKEKEFDTLVCTVSYALWKNRNAWVFGDNRRQHRPFTLAALVVEEYNLLINIDRSRGTAPGVGEGEHALRE